MARTRKDRHDIDDNTNDAAASRTNYSNKASEKGSGKVISSRDNDGDMIKAGASGGNGDSGPTGSCRTYPKSSKGSFKPDFNPQKKSDSSGSDWGVGGV